MARQGRPWAVVITIAVCALVAAGALATSAALRHRDVTTATEDTTTPPVTSGVGIDGCLVEPCTVLATAQVGGTAVDLVADKGGRSGRLRIGGAGASKVVEVTITNMGAVLAPDSLQCVADTLSACLLRGRSSDGVMDGQVVAGRSASWSELAQPFVSDAGYLALAPVTPDPGPEILVAQHDCQRKQDCSGTRVYLRVYNLRSQELGCTGYYQRLESLPGWPSVTLKKTDLKDCV